MKQILAITAIVLCLTATALTQTPPQARKWGFTWGRYDTLRKGYSEIPLRVLSVPGGKLGPKEKFRIFVSKLHNQTDRRVIGARFSWLLFDSRDMNKAVQTAQTDLVNLNIAGNQDAEVEIDVVNLEDIRFLEDNNPEGLFHLEVVASEVRYDDGSVWVVENIPGASRRPQKPN
jgi:hypothetical protein